MIPSTHAHTHTNTYYIHNKHTHTHTQMEYTHTWDYICMRPPVGERNSSTHNRMHTKPIPVFPFSSVDCNCHSDKWWYNALSMYLCIPFSLSLITLLYVICKHLIQIYHSQFLYAWACACQKLYIHIKIYFIYHGIYHANFPIIYLKKIT